MEHTVIDDVHRGNYANCSIQELHGVFDLDHSVTDVVHIQIVAWECTKPMGAISVLM